MGKKKDRERARQEAAHTVDMRDQLRLACDVVQTVVDAIGQEHNTQPAAMTLLHYGLEPLLAIHEELEGDADDEDDG